MALPFRTTEPAAPETEAGRAARLRREAAMLVEGHAQLDAGQGRTGQDLDAWLDAWEGNGDLPSRQPRNRP